MNKAQRLFQLFSPGDRILVGISGGKDSIALLYLLWWQSHLQNLPLELVPVHVTDQGTDNSDLGTISNWVSELGLDLHCVPPKEGSKSGKRDLSPCFICSWRRKHTLFAAARDLQCGTVALGHHSDDVAVTAMLNMFYQGRFASLLPSQSYFGGSFKLVRPLYFISEQAIIKLVRKERLPMVSSSCPHAAASSRQRAKGWLDHILKDRPESKRSLLGALHRQAYEFCGDGTPDISKRSRPKR